ncbi:MAG: guanylate kinase [Burkholderiales bacterium]|nr:guanylate kinase [Burkholderiales bacterium]
MPGNLYIVSAPSGAGKTSLVSALLAADPLVLKSVSYTTRGARPGEVDGRDYHFVTVDVFFRMLAHGDFLESALVHGNSYGTSKQWVAEHTAQGRDILLEIDWQGAVQVCKLAPEAVSIFVLPPSLAHLEDRLRKRAQDSDESIARRLGNAREEISHVTEFDYVIINEDFNRAAQDLICIIQAERLKLARQLTRNNNFFNLLK